MTGRALSYAGLFAMWAAVLVMMAAVIGAGMVGRG